MNRRTGAPAVRLTDAAKVYGGRTVLELPELSLTAGGRYALLGANGSGKSTLLRLLAGVIAPDRGSVNRDAAALRVGYLPQKPYAFSCSVRQNVLLATERGPRAQRQKQADRALEQAGLQHLAEARGDRLSGGETQRMALARLLVRTWDVLLLDEPTAAADIAAARQMEQDRKSVV